MTDAAEAAILIGSPTTIGTFQPVQTKKTRWNPILIILLFATTLGPAMSVGYNIGVINSPASYIRDWCNQTIIERYNVHLNAGELKFLWSSIVAIFLVGASIGSFGGGWIADRFGRKIAVLLSGVLFLCGAFFLQFCRNSKSIEMLLVGRIAVGLASGLTTATIPMYLTEIAPFELRGMFGVFTSIGITGGVVVGQVFSLEHVFGTADKWEYALSFFAIFIIICYLPAYFFPESPKFLYIIKKDTEKAINELMNLRKDVDIVNKEIHEMKLSMEGTPTARSFASVIVDRKLLLPLIITCCFQGGQQLSGVNAVFFYSVSIFEKAGLSKPDAEWANLGVGSINLLTALFGPLLMTRVNRRPLMLLSCAASSIFLLAITPIILNIEYAKWMPFACISCVFGYILFYQIGLGPIPYFIGSELFDVGPRPVAMALGSLSSWACNFLVAITFPSLQTAWGSYVFLPFSITCALLFLLTKFYLPETRNRNTADVVNSVSNGFRSRPYF